MGPTAPIPIPPPHAGSASRFRPGRLLWFAGVLSASVAGLFAASVAVSLRDALDHQEERARLVVSLTEESLTRSLESTESTLAAIGAVARQAGADGKGAALHQAFEQSLRFAPHLRQVVVIRRDGTILADSAHRSLGHRVDLGQLGFQQGVSPGASAEPAHLDLGGEVSGRYLPLIGVASDLSPRSIVPVALGAGPNLVVLAALNPTHLVRLLSLAGLGPSSSVRLTRLDGRPILAGEDPARSILVHAHPISLMGAVEQGVQVGTHRLSGPEGEIGIAAFRLSSHYPLAVVAAISHEDGVNAWLRSSGTLLFWGAVSLGGLLIGGGLLLREVLRRIGLQDQVRLLGLTQTVFAHSAEAMLITDESDRILAANPVFATLTGVDADALVGRSPDEFLGPETDAAADGAPSHWRLCSLSGPGRAVTVKRAPLASGTTIITLNDITERIENERRLQDALRQAEFANRAKSEFLAAMSHELRTPLNAILGFSEIIRDELGGPVEPSLCRDYVADIYNSGSHLRDIINDLLDLARIEAGKHNLAPAPLDVNAEIGVCARLVRERASHHGLSLTVEPCPSQPVLHADRRAVRQMLFNLLSNAIKFTPAGGRVTLACVQDDDGTIRLIVRDSGIGIAPELHDIVFNAYERAPNTIVRRIEGSGLGLALVRTMMTQHGGTVTLDSAPGAGSVFTLVFPPSSA